MLSSSVETKLEMPFWYKKEGFGSRMFRGWGNGRWKAVILAMARFSALGSSYYCCGWGPGSLYARCTLAAVALQHGSSGAASMVPFLNQKLGLGSPFICPYMLLNTFLETLNSILWKCKTQVL